MLVIQDKQKFPMPSMETIFEKYKKRPILNQQTYLPDHEVNPQQNLPLDKNFPENHQNDYSLIDDNNQVNDDFDQVLALIALYEGVYLPS